MIWWAVHEVMILGKVNVRGRTMGRILIAMWSFGAVMRERRRNSYEIEQGGKGDETVWSCFSPKTVV